MGRILPLVLGVALMIYALADCLQEKDFERMYLPKAMWVLLIVMLAYFGPIGWIVTSRMTRPQRPRRGPQRPMAPDDDPDFLRKLG